ncbi:MAG: hypothetical protein JSV62_10890 [Promethearchaeota archaeon]|nr:MAG: hypothetical protein JSV62_10890 [Candidatus Lokiarchaeota archaeon]
MSTFLKDFKFEKPPHKITYIDSKPLKLNSEFIFFHNKSKFRKELNQLQYLFKTYTNIALHAAGIRDSYLKEEYSEKFLIVLFSTAEIVKKSNEILNDHSELEIKPGCFYLQTTSEFILLLSKDLEGLKKGTEIMEIILTQVLEDYINQNRFDDYIKICSFELTNCIKSL